MNAVQFLDSDELELPKSRNARSDTFDIYLRHVFDTYLGLLKSLDDSDYISHQLKTFYQLAETLCSDVQEIIKEQFNGYPAKAYDKLKDALIKIEPHIKVLLSSPDVSGQMSHLYRIRTGGSNPLSRKEIFHIPFELRHLVNTQRYSIPGLPCLYLGGSTYVCWEELGRPHLDTIHLARFKVADGIPVRVLDFGYRPAEVAAYMNHEIDNVKVDNDKSKFIIAQGICWPLIAACSVQVKYKDAPFKPEYVLPQLILQWITNSTDCDGVRYFSTKIGQYFSYPMPAANFAFPSRTVAATGYCKKLTSQFELSEPLYWQLAKNSGLPAVHPPFMHFKLNLAEGAEVDYIGTEFGMMQFILSALPCKTI